MTSSASSRPTRWAARRHTSAWLVADRMEQRRAVAVAGGEEQPRELVHCARRYWGNSGDPPQSTTRYELHSDPSGDLRPPRRRGPRSSMRPRSTRTSRRAPSAAHFAARRRGAPPLDAPRAGARDPRSHARHPRRHRRRNPPDAAAIRPDTSTRSAGSSSRSRSCRSRIAVPALIFGSDAGLPVHTARHLGSFDVALAVGFLFAAWRPSRIPGLLPVVGRARGVPRRLVDARRDRGQHRRARRSASRDRLRRAGRGVAAEPARRARPVQLA